MTFDLMMSVGYEDVELGYEKDSELWLNMRLM